MKYYLGAGAGYRGRVWHHVCAHGSSRDCEELERFLARKYAPVAQVVLCKNGRSGLAMALMSLVEPGSKVLVNGFTCYAVVEAVRAAGCTPVYVDISRGDLNFNYETLTRAVTNYTPVRAIIIQNTLGNPVDIEAVERFAKEHDLVMIEDLAHSVGVKYRDGREAGTVGAATVLSFGKEKMIDAVNGGAVILREAPNGVSQGDDMLKGARSKVPTIEVEELLDKVPTPIKAPTKRARTSDAMRARFYPLFMAIYRGLNYVGLGKVWMAGLLKIHFVERSADNRLDLERKISPFEAKLALEQLKGLRRSGMRPIREFQLVSNRDEVLAELEKAGYYFGGFWYERPISPERYYKKVHFPEKECPVAVEVAREIINFPTHYRKAELKKAYEIVEKVGVRPTEVVTEVEEIKGVRNKVPTTEEVK